MIGLLNEIINIIAAYDDVNEWSPSRLQSSDIIVSSSLSSYMGVYSQIRVCIIKVIRIKFKLIAAALRTEQTYRRRCIEPCRFKSQYQTTGSSKQTPHVMATHDHPLSMCNYPTAYKLLLYRESRLSGAIFISHMHTRKLKVLIYSF